MTRALSKEIDGCANKIILPAGTRIHRLSTLEQYNLVKRSGLGIDPRSRPEDSIFYANVLRGLDFDEKRIRSQAYFITDSINKPVAITTFVIEPKIVIAKKKYLIREKEGVQVANYKKITTRDLPEFNVVPAWTRVRKDFRGKFALGGFRFLLNSLDRIVEVAPQNTYLDICAQGHMKGKLAKKVDEQFKARHGDYIPKEELGFEIELIGRSDLESRTTVKFAKYLKAEQIENVGVLPTLGPVFMKKLK